MTTPYYGAILLLNTTPDIETCEAISRDVVAEHKLSSPYSYRLTNTLPEGTPVDVYDQYTAQMKDLPRGSTYMLVYPTEESPTL